MKVKIDKQTLSVVLLLAGLVMVSFSAKSDILREIVLVISEQDTGDLDVKESIVTSSGVFAVRNSFLLWPAACNKLDKGESHYVMACESKDISLIFLSNDNKIRRGVVQISNIAGAKKLINLSGAYQEIPLTLSKHNDPVWLSMFKKGFFHVIEGYDHLLFILCLFLLLYQLSKTAIEVIGVFTAFTVSHGLVVAILNYWQLNISMAFIEVLVALSIATMAREALLQLEISGTHTESHQSLVTKYPAIASFLMGFIHGGAFSSVLLTVNEGWKNGFLPFLSFNLGIEMAQIIFVLGLTVIFIFLKKFLSAALIHSLQRPLLIGAGSVGIYWTLQRLVSI